MTPERLAALVAFYEAEFRRRTPAKSVRHVLAGQRVTFTDLADWYFQTYGEELSRLEHPQIATAIRPVKARLRAEFPDERWD